MAKFTNAQDTFTLNGVSNKEDVSDIIALISPTDTPFLSMLKKTSAANTNHEFLTDDLVAAANNAQLEGDTWVAEARPTPVRLGNTLQISKKTPSVTGSEEASAAYGNAGTMAYHMANASAEIKRDAEVALTTNGVKVVGAVAVARQLRGLEGWLATNDSRGVGGVAPNYLTNTAATDGTQRAFTEALLKDVLQKVFVSGGNPDTIMVGPLQKQTFSTFTGNSTRFKDADTQLNASISVYVSDFGTLKVVPNRFQRARSAFILDPKYWALAELRKPFMEDLPKAGDYLAKSLVWEYTLEARQEKSSGVIRDLS